MTKTSRFPVIRLLVLGQLILATTSWAQQRPPIVEKLAQTYGLESFGQVEAIRYTFNLQFPGVNVSRSWVWEPKTGQVSYEGKDKDGKPVKATYVRSQLNSQPANVKDDIDPAFLNDQYNLLFPFRVYWEPAPMCKTWAYKNCRSGRVRRGEWWRNILRRLAGIRREILGSFSSGLMVESRNSCIIGLDPSRRESS